MNKYLPLAIAILGSNLLAGVAAIATEINKKGDASRFTRPEPGRFTHRR